MTDTASTSLQTNERTFVVPTTQIHSLEDLESWKTSETFNNFLSFILRLNESVRGKKAPKPSERQKEIAAGNCTKLTDKLESMLEHFESWTAEFPPEVDTKSRFGNPAFKQWHQRLVDRGVDVIRGLGVPEKAVEELYSYIKESFGNAQRIDYGTGHEAHFVAFLYGLESLGLVSSDDYEALVLVVFKRYIKLMRALQTVYWLEPAGSHGVWGLDDYHFLPFLWGSGQLVDHKHFKPKSIHQKEVIEDFKEEYLYFECIHFINQVKTESLIWHSPMLNDISGVKVWSKVNEGMIKMYKAEVLGKYPIISTFCLDLF
eukprot:TRINITY_DN122_c0_g3_i2.p1 TRINITY_DN122_c0_g3~~TRINITY_DN122_c0_g3_i2.p1  ORF type:complete len:316 (+),score=47.51 TRINITY_DN122_c0_g3_i2:52-999(+)